MTGKIGPTFVDLAMERGEAIGQAMGRLLALRDVLKTLLQDKFGRLPKKLQKQIDTADDAEQLRQAIRGVHDCASLGDFRL